MPLDLKSSLLLDDVDTVDDVDTLVVVGVETPDDIDIEDDVETELEVETLVVVGVDTLDDVDVEINEDENSFSSFCFAKNCHKLN